MSTTANLTTRDVAEAIGKSADTVRRLTDSGVLRAIRVAGGHRRYEPADVLRLISGKADEAEPRDAA